MMRKHKVHFICFCFLCYSYPVGHKIKKSICVFQGAKISILPAA
uniref:Uncharacterized protein n=1 Tax=Arundo donax TaxID=35708 RepID=A0A0A9GRV3_ARUDO